MESESGTQQVAVHKHHLPHMHRRRVRKAGHHKTIRGVALLEDFIHYAVALLLIIVGIVVLYESAYEFLNSHEAFAERVTSVVNGVLFVIIVMEILRTVVSHFEDAGLQLKPFLTIGIISAVRHILSVGARLSLGSHEDKEAVRSSLFELGLNAGVVLVLILGLVLVWRFETKQAQTE